jgi:hypothetical protein
MVMALELAVMAAMDWHHLLLVVQLLAAVEAAVEVALLELAALVVVVQVLFLQDHQMELQAPLTQAVEAVVVQQAETFPALVAQVVLELSYLDIQTRSMT